VCFVRVIVVLREGRRALKFLAPQTRVLRTHFFYKTHALSSKFKMTTAPGYSIYQPEIYGNWEDAHRRCDNILKELGYQVRKSIYDWDLAQGYLKNHCLVEIFTNEKRIWVARGYQAVFSTAHTNVSEFLKAVLELVAKNVFFTVVGEEETTNHFAADDLNDTQILDTIASRLGGNDFGNVYYFDHEGNTVPIPKD